MPLSGGWGSPSGRLASQRYELINRVHAVLPPTGESSEVVHISAHCDHSKDAEPITYQTYPETLTSSAEYAEFDIRKTADNVLVVYHDGHAGRGGPLLAELGYQELCDRLGYVVPRVDEVMALLAGRLIGHLDLKEIGYEERVVELASSILGPENFVVTTLEDASVATINGRSPESGPRSRWDAACGACRAASGRPSGTANCFPCPGSAPAARTGLRRTTGSRGWAWPGRATGTASASWCGRSTMIS